jgi:hypothetical protein
LGCGAAANLAPLALQYPQACFTGCDLSAKALASARGVIEGLGLTNLDLRHADLCGVDDAWGRFDYIVCHDVFSWVDPGVRQKILAILRHNLAPHGVAYLFYDALPGWGLHGIARDLMRHHCRAIADPQQAVEQARSILSMAAAVQDQNQGPYAALMRDAYFVFSAMRDDQLYHLAFSEHHQPFYFHEFIDLIGEAGLQFIADSDLRRMAAPREPAAVRGFIEQLPRLERQQYLDFLNNCSSRSALLCHREVQLRGCPDDGVLRDCWISLAAAVRETLSAPGALIQEALSRLEERRPEFVAFGELAESGAPPTDFFMDAYTAGTIDVALSPPCISSRISDRPTVSPLVRLQAREGPAVTNQKCEPVWLTDLARHVATLLDGAHSRRAVNESVDSEIRSGRIAADWTLRLNDDGVDANRITGDILEYFRDHALLVVS